MKILAIGDIHQAPNLDEIEATITQVAPDQTVFLGDYFDQWFDTPNDAARTAKWLKWSLDQPNRVHLWGNHDLPYALLGRCPGWTQEKQAAVQEVIPTDGWGRLRLWHFLEGWLFTHAGLSKSVCPRIARPSSLVPMLRREEELAWKQLKRGESHWIWSASAIRSGNAKVGGILWCDLAEFTSLNGINQVFGHTPLRTLARMPGPKCVNWCIDVATREGVSEALVIDGNEGFPVRIGQRD